MKIPGSRLRRSIVVALAGVIASLSCGREITGPDAAGPVARGFTFDVRFPPMGGANSVAADLVPFSVVRVVLRNARGEIVVNRVIDFPSNAEEVDVALTVPLSFNAPATGETMDLSLAFANAAGDTVFRAGPVPVQVVPPSSEVEPPPPPVLTPEYVGPGADAQSVVISPNGLSLVAGDPFTFTAVALDAALQPIANTPIGWSSLDPTIATITTNTAGAGVTLPSRGTARIVADLATGQADTVVITVAPKLQGLVKVSGDAQTATVGAQLAQDVVVRVNATDGQPLAGVNVLFAAQNGGSAGVSSAASDANGLVQTTWTLGPGAGAQTLTATVSGAPTIVATFTATATAPVVTLVHHFPMNGDVNDAVGSAHGTILGGVTLANGRATFDGSTGYVELASAIVPTTGSFSVAFFANNRSSLSAFTIYLSQAPSGGPGFHVGHWSTGLIRAGDSWNPTTTPAPALDGLFHHYAVVSDAGLGTSRLYIDGVLRETLAGTLNPPAGAQVARFGKEYPGASLQNLDGDLDEVRVYDGALTDAQVAALHNAGPSTVGRLVFSQQPASTIAGGTIAPAVTVRVEDAMGRLQTGYTGIVGLTIGTNPGGASLGGTTAVAAVGGIATFSDLTIAAPGNGYTLVAMTEGYPNGTSAAFNITSAGPTINAWINPSGGAWSVGANWSEGRAPVEADSVVIAVDGTYTVTLDVNTTVSDLTVGGGTGTATLALPSSRQLTVNGIFAILPTGHVSTLSASNLGGTGSLAILGTMTITSATIAIPVSNLGTLTVQGTSSITGTYAPGLSTAMLRIQGSTSGAGNLTITDGFVNVGAIELTSLGSGFNSSLAVTNGTLINVAGGTITALPGAGGSRTLAAVLDNQGTVTLTTGLTVTKAEADHVNTGTISAVGGSFVVNQSGTDPSFANAGTIALSAGRNAAFTSGTVDLTGGTVSGYAGTLSVTGSTLIFTNPTVRTTLAVGAGTVIPSPFTVPAGDSLRLVTGTFTAPNLVIDGALIVEDVVSITSAVTKTATSAIIVRGSTTWGAATLTVANGFANNGTIELTSVGSGFNSQLTVTAGTLLNPAGGTIVASVGVGGSRVLAAQLNNQGTLTTNAPLTLAQADADHVNSGTIDLTTQNLTVTQTGTTPSFSNTGSITMANGRTLTVSGGELVLTGGTISNYAATLSTSSTTLTFTVPEARTRLSFGAGTVIPAGFTIPAGDSLRLVTGTFTAPTLQNDGQLIIEDVVTVASAITTGTGSAIIVRGSNAYGAATLGVTNAFVNTATIDLTSVLSGFNSTIVVSNGTFVNGPTGTILSSVGVGGSRTIDAQFDNQGTITVNTALTLQRAGAAHTNSGTIALAAANLTISMTGTTPTFTNTGAITMTAGRTLSVSGGALILTGGTVSGYGATLSTLATTLTFTVPEARTRLSFGAGTSIPAAFTIPAGDSLRLVTGTFAAPTLQNDGQLIIEDLVTVTSAITTGTGSTILVRGSAAYGAATLTVASGFTNTSVIDLNSVSSGFNSQLTVTAGTLVNAPGASILASVGVGGSRFLAAQLDNQGTVTTNAPLTLTSAEADHVNSGTINVASQNLTITQTGTTPSFTNTGTITLTAARTLAVSGGTLDLTGGAVNGYDATLSTSSTTLLFTVPEARTRLALGAGTVIPSGFTIPAGDSLRLVTGTFAAPTLQNDGTLIIEDLVTVTSALTTGSGSTILVRGSAAYGAATLTVANGFTNSSVIDLTSVGSGFNAQLTVTNGTLVNAASGSILSSVGVGGSRFLAAQLDNQGTVTVNTALTLTTADADHVNSGTINVIGANLTVTQSGTTPSFSNTGAIPLTAGRTMTVSGGTLDLTGGTISGYGATLSTSSTTLIFTVPEARTRLSFGAGTSIPAAFTIPAGDSLRLVTGTFAAPTLQNDGTLIVEDLVTVTSAITTGSGSTIRVRGSAAYGAATLTVANGFTNTATIDLTSVLSGFNAQLTVTNGTLVNAASGSILSSVGVGGSRFLAAQLDNQGTVTVNTDLTLAKADADHLNSGTISVIGSNFTVTQTGTTPSFTNSGAIPLTTSRTMVVTGGTLDLTGGTVSGYDATLSTSSTTLIFTVPEARTRLAMAAGTVIPSAFTIPAGDSLRLVTGTFTAPTLQNDGTLIAEDLVGITSAITTGAGSTILVRGSAAYGAATLTVANGFTNTATIDLSSVLSGFNAQLTVTNGTLVNAASGSILSSVGVGGSRFLAAQLDNQGTVTVNTPLTLTKADADHVNSGTINVIGANFTVTQSGTTPSFSNTGAIPLTASRAMTVSGGTLDLTGGTITGYGATLSTSSTTLIFTVPEARTRLAMAAGTVIPAAFTIPAGDSLRLVTGTFTAPTLQNDGQLIIEDLVTVTSAVTTGAGSTIYVRGSAAYGAATLTVANGFTNAGTLDLTSVGTGFGSQLTVTTGTLTNAASGTILASVGVGGNRTIAAPVAQGGALTVPTSAQLTVTGVLTLNPGSLTTVNGTLVKAGTCVQNGGSIAGSAGFTCP